MFLLLLFTLTNKTTNQKNKTTNNKQQTAKRPEASEIITHPYLKTAAPQAAIKKLLVEVFRAAAMAMF
jgi:hypothetical protein